jgi:2,3-diketo-5-methylthio-1-phosphopentane phosphatase
MPTPTAKSQAERVLVSDFDGTMTRNDFYKLAIEKLLPADVPDYWAQYRAGEITHFEALRRYFAAIRAPEYEVRAVVEQMELDPQLPAAIDALRSAGWHIVVTSAGCDWYIRWLLASVGVELEVHSNPGRFETGKGLLMEMPNGSKYFSSSLGVDKTGVVRDYLNRGWAVGFAGDGFPDADPARLVPGERRFARGDLAEVLHDEELPFHSYQSWSEIAERLLL